jgi:LacI family transcriptional regulator
VMAVRELLDSGVQFDGIVGCSDHHSAAALNVLTERGRKVPEHVKLVGIDNAPFCNFAAVPLSSVSQEYDVRGRHAVRLLMTLLRGESAYLIQIPPVVHARASSGA